MDTMGIGTRVRIADKSIYAGQTGTVIEVTGPKTRRVALDGESSEAGLKWSVNKLVAL